MKKVAVVILNFKVCKQAIKCAESVQASDYKNLEVIVVDNNSQDGIDEEIKKVPGVTFIQTGDNLGYSGGNNLGIKRALKDGADFVFILNADMVVEKNTISRLAEAAEKEGVGIVGPKVLFMDEKTIWYAGGIFDRANVIGSHRGVDEVDHGQYDQEEETDYVAGGALFAKGEVFKKIGLFDEKYFLYYEDSDFCFRVRKAGFRVRYIPAAVVYHANAQSTGLGSPLQDYFITRNRMLFASKFLPFRTRFALLREAIRNIPLPMRRLALFDFLRNNLGKGSYIR